MKYVNLAEEIVRLVGGKENITGLSHCVTRLRFTLRDEDAADDAALKELEGVLAVNRSSGQYQVIVGNKVRPLFSLLNEQLNLNAGAARAEPAPEPTEKKKWSARVLDFMSSVMLPVIPIICACGLLKAFNVLLPLLGLYGTDSGIYTLLAAMGDTAFYFISAFFGYNAFKKLGGTPFIGLLLGLMLCYPTINGVDINLFGLTINATYTSTMLPIILISLFAAWLEKGLNKILPESIHNFFGPMLVVLIAFPIGFAFIGPVCNIISFGISSLINGCYELSPVIAGILVGGLFQVLVLLGMHFVLMGFAVMDVIQGVPSPIMALTLGCTTAVAGACLAVWLKSRDKKQKSLALNAFIQSGVFTITEPATYGILVPNMRVFMAVNIGGAVGGIIAGLFGIKAYTIGGMGLLVMSIPTYLNPENPQIFPIILAMLAGFVTTFVLVMLFYKDGGSSRIPFKTKKEKKA